MTYTSQMDLDIRLSTHIEMAFLNKTESFKTYFISDEAVIMLTKTEFLEKIIFDNKY